MYWLGLRVFKRFRKFSMTLLEFSSSNLENFKLFFQRKVFVYSFYNRLYIILELFKIYTSYIIRCHMFRGLIFRINFA